MTTPKQLETLSGTCEQVNAKGTGIKVIGEWLNVSQYHPIAVMPTPGELVEVTIERSDRGAWINSLRIIGPSAGAAPSATSTNRDHAIAKMSALRSAAIYCGHRSTVTEDAKSSDVLKIAEAWLAWLEQENTP